MRKTKAKKNALTETDFDEILADVFIFGIEYVLARY